MLRVVQQANIMWNIWYLTKVKFRCYKMGFIKLFSYLYTCDKTALNQHEWSAVYPTKSSTSYVHVGLWVGKFPEIYSNLSRKLKKLFLTSTLYRPKYLKYLSFIHISWFLHWTKIVKKLFLLSLLWLLVVSGNFLLILNFRIFYIPSQSRFLYHI